MAFCKYSSSYIISDKTVVDNIFINDFLPYAPNLAVKVYLMGLSKCANANAIDNNITNFANILDVTEEEIKEAFLYWEGQGLVKILSTTPIEVVFLPPMPNISHIKKFEPTKFLEFNHQIKEIITARETTATELETYYNLIEDDHIQPEALLMIAKYCVGLRGENVGYHYIKTVAKNWLNEGVRTADDVENKIQELGLLDDKVRLVLNALGTKRKIQLEDIQLLNTWLEKLDFELNVVVYLAKRFSMKKKADMQFLNQQLLKYYEKKLSSISEIEEYENEKDSLYDTAKAVVKGLGLYYEDLSKVVDTYVIQWKQQGYNSNTLSQIADYCFKNSIRTLEAYNDVVQKLFKLGIVSTEALNEYLSDLIETDKQIISILERLDIKRKVNNFDRNYYKTWTENWNFSTDLLNYAIDL
ncbi:MAG: DnaD domain protein, partial [Clostridia bacterium]|nr:DnaD domain protein [Clostridia bacterium]